MSERIPERTSEHISERKSVNPWFIFFLICVPIFIGSVDLTSIVVVLPQATLDLLGTKGLNKADQALWAVTAYLLAYTISLALVGRLSDVLSRKRIFLICGAIFIVGSVWAGMATDLPLTVLKTLPIWPDRDLLPLISLVIGRIVQAIGAGASVSVGMALVSDVFPPDHRAEAISLIGAIDSLGWVVGNLYAGLILQVLPSWRWLFFINASVALASLLVATWALRHTKSAATGGSYDVRGAVVFASGLTALVIALVSLNNPSPTAYGLIALSVALFVLFGWLQTRTKNALFDMHFIRQREVRAALLTNLIVGFGLILMVAGVPLMINLRSLFLRGEGLLTGALRAGIMLSALTLPLIVAVLVGESRYRRVGAAVPVSIGLTIGMIGFLGASFWGYTVPSAFIALPLALVGMGLGLTIGPLSLVVVDAAEASARGLASSLVLMMRLLGMTFGTPLAASLTLKLANDWASERVQNMGTFHDIARSMLIPPMATDALARVMLAGVVACAIGLIAFYLPRARRAFMGGLGLRAAMAGLAVLVMVVLLVGTVGTVDSATTPTLLSNPIAQQLPPNVTFYAALNIQQLFLKNTERPLDALLNLANAMSAPPASAPPATATAAVTPTTVPPTATSAQASPVPPTPTPAPQSPPAQPPQPAQPAQAADNGSPTDNLIKDFFRAKKWDAQSYKAFCPEERPPDQWQDCFTGSLLSWIGPQAAFALLPRTRSDQDYVFAFQATNRNNAISFATNLAVALGEKEPVEAGPNIRILTINADTPDERLIAITQAYVLVGTPKAVQYTLNHGQASLSDQPDYQLITSQLPPVDFATFYMRSNNFDTDLKPTFDSVFHGTPINSGLQRLTKGAAFGLARTSSAPTLIGMAMRVDEQQLTVDVVANVPFSLQKLNALPVPAALLNLVPDQSHLWAAANVNIAGLVREVNIANVLGQLLPANSAASALGPVVLGSLGQTVQNLLTYAHGDVLITALPVQAQAATSAQSDMVVVLPLVEKEDVSIASALGALKNQLQFLGITGAIAVESQAATTNTGEIVSVHGKALESVLPGGFQYTLTKDNLLVLTTGNKLLEYLAAPKANNAGSFSPDATHDHFFYAYVDPGNVNLTASLAGQIKRSGLYLNLVLKAK